MYTNEVVSLGGQRTLRDPDELRSALQPLCEENNADIAILDLTDVHHVPTTAYGVICSAYRHPKDQGRRLHVVANVPELRSYLDNEGVCDEYGMPVFQTLVNAQRLSPRGLCKAYYDRFNAVPETLSQALAHFDSQILTFETTMEFLMKVAPPGEFRPR